MKLKRGDRVALTRDGATWYVERVKPEEQLVLIRCSKNKLELRGAAAMRSLTLIQMGGL